MDDLRIDPVTVIPAACLSAEAVRAGGPGGQNVNKVATKIVLVFEAAGCAVLTDAAKARLRSLAGRRMDREGRLRIAGQRHRTRKQNLEDCRERLAALVRAALVIPRARTRTAPSRASMERRLEAKRRRSVTKGLRRRPDAS